MPRRSPPTHGRTPTEPSQLRIIGGLLRGRKFTYHGDPGTRPMKDRIREAVFNLIGYEVKGKHAIDLFAGTGALGLEALSRGAAKATFIERHFPTAATLRQNIAELDLGEVSRVITSDTFFWASRLPESLDGPPAVDTTSSPTPWAVFCSPPYALYRDRESDMLGLIDRLATSAPRGSVIVVETDADFDMGKLPHADCWDVRFYDPTQVAVGYTPLEQDQEGRSDD